MVKVSVICVAYNHEKYIKDALDSFIMQRTDFDFEVLINDDASTDRTPEIIREYAEKYPNIIKPVFQKKNLYSQGLNILETALLPKAQGEYFAFIDGDDYWSSPDKLQRQVDILDKHPEFSACVHNTLQHDCTGKTLDTPIYNYGSDRVIIFEDAVWGMPYHTSSLMVRREHVENRPDFYYEAKNDGDDYPQAIWLTLNGGIYYIDEVMSVYRSVSCSTAWRSITCSTNEKLARHFETKVRILRLLRNHVSGEKLELTDRVILDFRYYILELTEHFADLKKEEFREIYNSRNLFYKLKLFIKIRLYPIFSLYKRLRNMSA